MTAFHLHKACIECVFEEIGLLFQLRPIMTAKLGSKIRCLFTATKSPNSKPFVSRQIFRWQAELRLWLYHHWPEKMNAGVFGRQSLLASLALVHLFPRHRDYLPWRLKLMALLTKTIYQSLPRSKVTFLGESWFLWLDDRIKEQASTARSEF